MLKKRRDIYFSPTVTWKTAREILIGAREKNTMLIELVFSTILTFGNPIAVAYPAQLPPDGSAGTTETTASKTLRDARDLILKQGSEQTYWTRGLLGRVIALQVRAHDFDGAIESLRGHGDDPNFASTVVDLAEALARNGQIGRAFEVLRLTPEYASPGYYSHGTVQLQWVDHLLETGKLGPAVQAVTQTSPLRYRQLGEVKLAIAYSKASNTPQVSVHLDKASLIASRLADEEDKVYAINQITDAQIQMGRTSAARSTIMQLTGSQVYHDPSTRALAYRQSAALAVKLHDRQLARRLFRCAIDSCTAVEKHGRMNALQVVAEDQAKAGFIDDALQTAGSMKHSTVDFTVDANREEALFHIACGQSAANDVKAAVATSLLIKYFVQFRDDALDAIVGNLIAAQNLESALALTNRFSDTMRGAAAALRIATAFANSSNRQRAIEIAKRIDLHPTFFLGSGSSTSFDYLRPESWGVDYNASMATSNGLRAASLRRTSELAESAMMFKQALGGNPELSYATAFSQIDSEIVTSLARAHARYGSPAAALDWARKIGNSDKIDSPADYSAISGVERRVLALCGAVEGMMDRHSATGRKPMKR